MTDGGEPRKQVVRDVRTPSKSVVRQQTHLAVEWSLGCALNTRFAREESATELRLNEELGVEDERSGVEGSSGNGGVSSVSSGNGMADGRC